MIDDRKTYTDGLRALADFLDSHPHVPLPYETRVTSFPDDDALPTVIRSLGSFDKEFILDTVYLVKRFGPIKYAVYVARDKVCTRRVVGTTVAPAIPERIIELVEWDCGPLLGKEVTESEPLPNVDVR